MCETGSSSPSSLRWRSGVTGWRERSCRSSCGRTISYRCALFYYSRSLFVPDAVRSDILQWDHSSRLDCHPGITRTLDSLRHRFWWPTMDQDTRSFVAACATCARSKTSNKPRSGLLRPLPIPSRPWSNIALDFVTGLPPSRGNTTILTIIDRFSKAAHFVALPGLPSARETAELMVSQVFRIHGIPSDIVSDRGPQFISQVWRAFCLALGTTASLSAGYQTSDQRPGVGKHTHSVSQPPIPPHGAFIFPG